MPNLKPFREAKESELFLGTGKIIHREIRPAFGRKTKGRFLLYTGFIVVKELNGDSTIPLRFFNLYPQQKKQIEELDQIWFLGNLQEYKAQLQMVNPRIHSLLDQDWGESLGKWLVEYPTVNKVPGSYTGKLFSQLPENFWSSFSSEFGTDELNDTTLSSAFRTLHAQISPTSDFKNLRKMAEERLAYEEFFIDQLKITTRRRFIKKKAGPVIETDQDALNVFLKVLPYQLTEDQNKAIHQILEDMKSGHPMMRMLQGDVGCGKTIVAFLVALQVIQQGGQVAFMCPTEALAQQHAKSLSEIFGHLPFLKPALLLGSMKKKAKDSLNKALINGEANFVIGTHSLFQESVQFKNLNLAIIDEQHKFGVEQRLMLTSKGAGTHCLIMSATPIPRTLSLAQYGDLDFTTIKTMPAGRKGIKTRIVAKENYSKYLDFLKQRLQMGDQGYMVFPAIEESETMNLQNVTEAYEKYQKDLPGVRMAVLHGKMKPEDKEATVQLFTEGKIQILISTSVIEVGINIPNATFMSIYDPDRFGLSSLHQLRGRVGRGTKAGFCFLVLGKDLAPASVERLEVMEKTNDGFVIAEADLQNRGEGDLFGVDQSGVVTRRRIADFMKHSHILEKVYHDVQQLMKEHPEKIDPLLLKLARDQKILDTI
ncbi:MAG: ATP-dependent DNA helicase RecG [Bacteriovoracaceae bacterium]|nr:ATP-dependent DNA helicase RecG [Bacteriovoracaceae bacterium]